MRGRGAHAALALAALAASVACASVSSMPARPGTVWGFTAPWDPRSAETAVARAGQLDGIFTGWAALDSATGQPTLLHPDTLRALLPGGTRPMLHVTSWLVDRWRTDVVLALAADGDRLARAAGALAALAQPYRGVVLDLESHTPEELPALARVVQAMADSLHARGVRPVAVAVPAPDTLAYPARPLLRSADLLLVMLYDEHWTGSAPGPVASPAWVQRWLEARVAEAGAHRVVAGLPLYGYRWRAGAATVDVAYAEALRIADSAGVPIRRDERTGTLTARAPDVWELWMPDAPLLERLFDLVRESGVSRVALWRLGVEDPAIWRSVLAR